MSDEDMAVTISLQKQKRNIQVGILGLLIFLGSYLTLYSDSHNDKRYVMIEAYAKDRAADNLLHTQETSDFQRRLSEHSDTLKEIQTDVKSLLYEVPNLYDRQQENTDRKIKALKDAQ